MIKQVRSQYNLKTNRNGVMSLFLSYFIQELAENVVLCIAVFRNFYKVHDTNQIKERSGEVL
jgi:hypothetical protein